MTYELAKLLTTLKEEVEGKEKRMLPDFYEEDAKRNYLENLEIGSYNQALEDISSIITEHIKRIKE